MATPQATELLAFHRMAEHRRRAERVNREGWRDAAAAPRPPFATFRAVVGRGIIRLGELVAGPHVRAPQPRHASPAFPS